MKSLNRKKLLQLLTLGIVLAAIPFVEVSSQCLSDYSYVVDSSNLKVTFTNKSQGVGLNYYWSFGDGTNANDTNPIHSFSKNGWYYVCLNIVNVDTTCVDVKCEFIKVYKAPPIPCNADYEFQFVGNNPKLVRFKDKTLGDSSNTVLWVIRDSTISNQKEFTTEFRDTGKYTVCILSSGVNCADSACKVIEIVLNLPNCNADYTYKLLSDSGENNKRIAVFTNSSTGDSLLSYQWDFGDGQISLTKEPIHFYEQPGNYIVCLSVGIGNLCFDSTCKKVEISVATGQEEFINKHEQIKVYPVPLKDYLMIEGQLLNDEVVRFELFNGTGHKVYGNNEKVITGSNSIRIAIPEDLETGIYWLRIWTSTAISNIKLSK